MSGKTTIEAVLLGGMVLSSWLGVLGMLRMRTPTEALHYLSLPACVGSVLLAAATFVETGFSVTAWKTALIGVMLLAVNAVVTHATARAFRTRAVGHWQPHEDENIPRAEKELAA